MLLDLELPLLGLLCDLSFNLGDLEAVSIKASKPILFRKVEYLLLFASRFRVSASRTPK